MGATIVGIYRQDIYDKVIRAGKSLWIKVYTGTVDDWIAGCDRLVKKYGSDRLYFYFNPMPIEDAKKLMAYAEEIQKNTLKMSSALIEELVAERKYQKKTQQDIADITGILPANIARFENGSRVPTLVVLQKYASALGKRIKVELCDQEAK